MTIKTGLGFLSGIASGIALTGCLLASPDEAAPAAGAQQASRTADLTQISIHADEGAGLVLYREGVSGPWLTPAPLKPGEWEAYVSGPYTVMIVCPFDDVAHTVLTSQTLEDDHMVWASCLYQEGPLALTGEMVQPGRVALGDTGDSSPSTPNWQIYVPAYEGTYDLVANSVDRIAIRRGIAMTADRTIATIDLAHEGAPFVSVPVTYTNPLPGDVLTSQTYLRTRSTFAILGDRPLPARFVPPALLIASDQQDTSFRARSSTDDTSTFRFLRRVPSAGAQPPVTFAQHFTGVQAAPDANGDLQISWASLQSDLTYFNVSDLNGNYIDLLATESYLAATGAHSLTMDTQVPGFLPQWRIDLSAYYYSVSAAYGSRYEGGRSATIFTRDVFTAAARRDPAKRDALAQQKLRHEQLRRVSPEDEPLRELR